MNTNVLLNEGIATLPIAQHENHIYKIDNVLNRIKGNNIRLAFIHRLSFNEPLGIGYLSAYLKMCFPYIEIELFDPKIDSINDIKNFCPTFVLYSVMTGQHRECINRNKRLKKELDPFISVFGGPHPTYFPEMIHEDGVDIICKGEGELPLKNLVSMTLSHSDIRHIRGLYVKHEGIIYKNDVDNFIQDLDTLPFPDRDLYYRKSEFLRSYGRKPLLGARGCPFKCSYCYNSALNSIFKGHGKVLRCRSPKSVVDEIAMIKSMHDVRFVAFIEDVFSGVRIEWLKEFQEQYSRISIPFFVSIRAEFIKPEIAKYLRKSGCISASMAIEHGDYEYRKKYLFRNMTNEMLIDGARILESEGIRVASPIMLGLPFSGIEDDLKSLKLVCQANFTHATTAIFQPYPGTALTDLCLNKKLIDKTDIDNLNEDFYSVAYIKDIDYEKVKKLHNCFSVLWLMNKWFNVDVIKCFEKLPSSIVIKMLNIAIKYLTFKKIIGYRRSYKEIIMEIYNALTSGVFGFRIKKKTIW